MTALTIDIDDRMMEALRETAERRHTTVDAVVRATLTEALERFPAPKSFRELAEQASLSFEAGRTWDREETHARPMLR